MSQYMHTKINPRGSHRVKVILDHYSFSAGFSNKSVAYVYADTEVMHEMAN